MQLCSHSPLHDDMKPMLDITSRHTSRNTGLVHVTSESFTALERTVKASLTEMVRPSNLPEADINVSPATLPAWRPDVPGLWHCYPGTWAHGNGKSGGSVMGRQREVEGGSGEMQRKSSQ